jgi:hypothetical protein
VGCFLWATFQKKRTEISPFRKHVKKRDLTVVVVLFSLKMQWSEILSTALIEKKQNFQQITIEVAIGVKRVATDVQTLNVFVAVSIGPVDLLGTNVTSVMKNKIDKSHEYQVTSNSSFFSSFVSSLAGCRCFAFLFSDDSSGLSSKNKNPKQRISINIFNKNSESLPSKDYSVSWRSSGDIKSKHN